MPRQRDPTWDHVHEDPVTSKLTCLYCKESFVSTITRMKAHLAKLPCRDIQICKDVPDNVAEEVRLSLERKKPKTSHGVASSSQANFGQTQAQAMINSMLPPVASNTQSTIFSLVRKKEKEEADNCLMEAIVDNCLPFNILRSKTFQVAIEKISRLGAGYKLPSFETARTKLLGGLKERAEEYVRSVKKNWEVTGCTVMSDGWTDRRNRPHLNLLVSSPHGTVFLKSICTSGQRKDANFIADFIIGAIEESIGPENVVQVIADNASNYTAAGIIIERKWPHIFKTNCAAHCIDLMLEDIDKIDSVQPIMENARRITKFIYRYQHVHALMKKYTEGAELKRPGATRFATQFLCLQSVLKQEQPLRFMVASNDWKELPQSKTIDGEEISSIILGVVFWSEGKEILQGVEPLVKVLRLVDGEGSTLGYLYEAMDRAKEAIKEVYKEKRAKCETFWHIIDRQWNDLLHSPIHAAAAYFNPQFMLDGRIKFTDPEVKDGIDKVFKKMVPIERQKQVHAEFTSYYRKSKEIFDGMAYEFLPGVHPNVGCIGIGICHDIRFPELAALYRARGAHLICYPGAFNMGTGKLLWELMQRARAADNQLFVATCSPARDTKADYVTWGHSTLVGPSGEIIATSDHEETTVFAEIDYSLINLRREELPLEKQRRGDVYQLVDVERLNLTL